MLGKPQIKYLGYLVNSSGIFPQPKKVQVIQDFPKLNTVVELRRFLGMINFYRRCIPKAAEEQMPLIQYQQTVRKMTVHQLSGHLRQKRLLINSKKG